MLMDRFVEETRRLHWAPLHDAVRRDMETTCVMQRMPIGVMGAANIARRSVLPAIQALAGDFELVAIASRTRSKAEELARAFDCEATDNYEALLSDNRIRALYIPLPTGLHREWIMRALESGKHVYAEKSIALTLADAKEMVASARASGCALMEGYMFQYHRQHEYVADRLRSGAIGDIRHFSSSFGFPPLDPSNFRYNPELGGGVLMDAAGYPLRAAHLLLGCELEVKAAALHFDPEKATETYGSAFLAGPSGVGASISFGFDNFYQCQYEIWGSRGRILVPKAFTPGPEFSPSVIVETPTGRTVVEIEADNHFVGALGEFRRVIASPEGRELHYEQILLQSRSIELMRTLGSSVR